MPITFNQALQIYNCDFYGDDDHLNFVKRVFQSSLWHNLSAQTNVYIPTTQTGSQEHLLTALRFRIPIFYGQIRDDLFSWEKVQKLLGYGYDSIPCNPLIISNTRFAISGPVLIMPPNKGQSWDESVKINITHVWGVNFEQPTTADYRAIVSPDGVPDYDKYFSRQLELFRLIVSSSLHVMERNQHTGVDIQMPLIGAGCFLKALSNNHKQKCIIHIIRALFKVVKEMPNYVNLKLCIFNPSEFSNWLMPALLGTEQSCANFIVGSGTNNGNVLNNIPDPKQTERSSVVINAWDTHSFIGNGGNGDLTVDGMVVANAGNRNNKSRNTSYLHNPFFNMHMFNPTKWVNCNVNSYDA